ncbi:MAG: ROK family protein [Candidatus Kaistia colombiensis]|nr:MAG: ROK family protein [Kaistia sp.]
MPRLVEIIRGYLVERAIPPSRVSEISIAIPGTTDETTGTLLWSPTVAVEVGSVPGPVSEALGIRASMTNDVNMMAQALHSRDPGRFGGTFATIFIAYGVGMGLYINGRLFTGAFGSGAEFGHANHMPGGALCRCGRRGCIEAYVADYAIYRAVENLPPDLSPTEIDPDAETMRALEQRARDGEDRVRMAYHQAGLALGYGLSRLIALLNPQRVAFTGRGVAAFDLMEAGFRAGLERGAGGRAGAHDRDRGVLGRGRPRRCRHSRRRDAAARPRGVCQLRPRPGRAAEAGWRRSARPADLKA